MSSRAATIAIASALALTACATVPGAHLADVKPASAYRADQTFAAPAAGLARRRLVARIQ